MWKGGNFSSSSSSNAPCSLSAPAVVHLHIRTVRNCSHISVCVSFPYATAPHTAYLPVRCCYPDLISLSEQ